MSEDGRGHLADQKDRDKSERDEDISHVARRGDRVRVIRDAPALSHTDPQFHSRWSAFLHCPIEWPWPRRIFRNAWDNRYVPSSNRSEEHTSELQSPCNL